MRMHACDGWSCLRMWMQVDWRPDVLQAALRSCGGVAQCE
jgi:hypothetical protein